MHQLLLWMTMLLQIGLHRVLCIGGFWHFCLPGVWSTGRPKMLVAPYLNFLFLWIFFRQVEGTLWIKVISSKAAEVQENWCRQLPKYIRHRQRTAFYILLLPRTALSSPLSKEPIFSWCHSCALEVQSYMHPFLTTVVLQHSGLKFAKNLWLWCWFMNK